MSEEAPTLLSDAVLHDRRDNLRRIFESSGGDYEARISPIRAEIRSATMDGGTLRDAHARLVAQKSKADGWRAVDEMEWAAALLDCLESATPTTEEKLQEAEAAAPVKPKKERKGRKPAKPRAPTVGWAQKIGRSGTRLKLSKVLSFEEIQAGLQGAAWKARPLPDERHTGVCLVSSANDVDFTDLSKWKFGEYGVYGFRVDRRRVPAGTLAAEVEKKIRAEEKNAGRTLGKKFCKQIKNEVRRELLAEALPETQVYSVLVAPTEGWALVDGPPQVVEEVRSQLGARGWPLSNSIQPVIRARLAAATGERYRTDLRVPNHATAPSDGEEYADIPAGIFSDFMLWLATPGTSWRSQAWELDEKVSWKLAGGPIKIRVPVENTHNDVTLEDADSAALTASLAEGGRLMAVRVAIEDRQEVPPSESPDGPAPAAIVHTYHLSLEVIHGSKTRSAGLRIHGMGLPTMKGGDSAEALVFERVALHKRLWLMLESLFEAYASDRCQDWQPVIDAARDWVGLELTRRFVFDERTGQGWLFAPQQLQIEAIEDKNAEAPAPKKTGKGRGKK